MKVFNGRSATEDYMSTHSLTFSTPEMTLRKFALWLGEQVNGAGNVQVPRVETYLEEKGQKSQGDFSPNVDDSFKPTGAVADMYGDFPSSPTDQMTPPQMTPLNRETLEPEPRFCISCGQKLKANAKFCTKCGGSQS
ncbi:MAG: zinc ribbon domain-containing protein [Nitrososphaera sp.]|nr:zinc ribbon domain-containing protein [Nitrososphaera sp.]